jgi:hypothetical protein
MIPKCDLSSTCSLSFTHKIRHLLHESILKIGPSGDTRTSHSAHNNTESHTESQKMVNYRPILVRMMSFLDKVDYEPDKHFTLAELGGLNPDRLMEAIIEDAHLKKEKENFGKESIPSRGVSTSASPV